MKPAASARNVDDYLAAVPKEAWVVSPSVIDAHNELKRYETAKATGR